MASIRNSKGLYWGLIVTFFVLYALVGFVSTLHSITFFELANTMWMAVLLGITYEVGQAAVLFSILMSDNSKKMLPWLLMILLTALQVTANVYASFKFMDSSGSNDWTFWQRSILFWLEADGPEMFKVVISWITGALLPVVALGMTALVAENLKLKDEQNNKPLGGDILESAGEAEDDVEPTTHEETEKELSKIGVKIEDGGKINFNADEEKYVEKAKENIQKAADKLKNLNYIEDKSHEIKFDDELEDVNDMLDLQEQTKEVKENPFDREASIKGFAEELLENIVTTDPDEHKVKKNVDGVLEVEPQIVVDIPTNEDPVEPEYEFLKDAYLKKIGKEEEMFAESDIAPAEIPVDEIPEEKLKTNPKGKKITKKPINTSRGWHLKKLHIDDNGDVYNFGKYNPDEHAVAPPEEQDSSKKAWG